MKILIDKDSVIVLCIYVSHKNILLILHPDPSLSGPGTTLKLVVNNRPEMFNSGDIQTCRLVHQALH